MYPLGTWFVLGICVWIPCIKEMIMMMMMMMVVVVMVMMMMMMIIIIIIIIIINNKNYVLKLSAFVFARK